jgi:hypothetical protein
MTKDENIHYLTLRSEECRLPSEDVEKISQKLKELQEGDYEHLKRISEPAFRTWCKEVCSN